MTTPAKKVPQKLNIVLTKRDGWNFGLGFMFAVTVFLVVIVPAMGCGLLIIISSASSSLERLFL